MTQRLRAAEPHQPEGWLHPQGYEAFVEQLPEPMYIDTRYGQPVAAQIIGPPYGVPVFTFHGTPGSRIGPHPHSEMLESIGIRLIAFDRPGSGRSPRQIGRTIAHTASIVEDIAYSLGIERFGLLARSGGVPHALGCAALLGERVSAQVLMAGLAPRHADITWTAGMTEDNQAAHDAALKDLQSLIEQHKKAADDVQKNPFALVDQLLPDFKKSDRFPFLEDEVALAIAAGHAEGLRQNGAGWTDDLRALHMLWGFTISNIHVPTLLWHGIDDPFNTPQHSAWLHQQIPGSTLMKEAGSSHFSLLLHFGTALSFIRGHHLGSELEEQLYARTAAYKEKIHAEADALFERCPLPGVAALEGASLITKNAVRRLLLHVRGDPEGFAVREILEAQP